MGQTEMSARLRPREPAESQRNGNDMKVTQHIFRALNDPVAQRDSSVANSYLEQARALAPDLPTRHQAATARASNVVRTGEILQPDATAWSPRLENVGVSSTADELNTCRTSALFLLQLPRA